MTSLLMRAQVMNEDKMARLFTKLAHVPEDMRVPFEQMAEDFWANNRKTFDEQGPGWKPLAASTVKDRARHGLGPEPILVRTARLKASLTTPDAEGAVYEIYPQQMILGTRLQTDNRRGQKYNLGMLHQTGTRRGMPARPPLVITSRLRQQWTDRMAKWLQEEFNWTSLD